MIDPDKRNAIYQLHLAGVPLEQIARQLHVARNTVRAIVRQKGVAPQAVRKDKIVLDVDLLRQLYQQCDGWLQRVHEELVEKRGIQVSYPTLTRRVRELGLGQVQKARCEHVPDEPGLEMQHDTTLYTVKLTGRPTRVIASLLYLRYSKRRYLRFYRVFNRFFMKCFLHEALMFWGHAARQCIIDNTNLARLRGSGRHAVIVPEMAAFAEAYGFTFLCHELRHPNRKAGEERSFWSVETNFLPGRTFESLEDLNQQAHQWATVRMEHRPASKTGLIPAKAFEHECSYLTPLPGELPAPYCSLERGTDPYGYVSVEGNYYWVPGTKRGDVKVLRYAERLKIYQQRKCVAEYALPADGVKNAHFHPEGYAPPRHLPKYRKHGSQHEEQRLRALGPELAIVKKSGGRLESGRVGGLTSINTTYKRSSPMKREAYRAVEVKRVFIEALVTNRRGVSAVVGIDVAKDELIATVRWSDGSFERPWRADNPDEIHDLVHRLTDLGAGRSLRIAMESTGTYGDAVRQALTDAKLEVHRVSGKAVHDYAEIFDGVPSQHDGKDAAMVAELAALGKSSPWPYQPPSEFDQELHYWVERADVQQRIVMLWLGRLEALLARHWPEATRHLELNSATLLRVVSHYGGPAALAADAVAVQRLKGWGRQFLKQEKIERFVQVAGASVGVRQTATDRRRMMEAAQAALAAKHEVAAAEEHLKKLAQTHATLVRQAAVVGWATACVLWAHLGDPADYHCAEAYRKAMGLNLKERSSGRYQGQLKITKRGPGAVRRWLYFAAMRLSKKAGIVGWYEAKKGDRPKGGKRALIAVMRKLALGLYVLGVRDEPFEARRLFSAAVGKHSRRKSKDKPRKEWQKT